MKRLTLIVACLAASVAIMAQAPVRQMIVTSKTGVPQAFFVQDIEDISFVEVTSSYEEKITSYTVADGIATFEATPTAGFRLSHWTVDETIVVQKDLKIKINEAFYSSEVKAHYSLDLQQDGHSYVDILDNGTLWATHNVGAASPDDYGDYFAWGEILPKNDVEIMCDWSTYKWGAESELTKYNTKESYAADGILPDNIVTLTTDDDAASSEWGANWRMPTYDELSALLENTDKTVYLSFQEENEGLGQKAGYIIQNAEHKDRVLFFPAAGFRYWDGLYSDGAECFYWSSSLYDGSPNFAWCAKIGYYMSHTYERFYGFSVRPVCATPDR